MTTAIETIRIGEDEIHGIRSEDGGRWVVVRRLCEVLGLDESSQRRKLQDPERTPWAVTVAMTATGPDGKNYESFCLHVDGVPMFLATVDVSRCAEEAKPKIVRFQREAARVLADWAYGRKPAAPTAALDLRDPAALRGLLAQVIEANLEQAKELEVARPKAAFVDRYVGAARGLIGLQQLAKQLHQPERKFVEWLRSAGYLYRDGDGTLVPRAEYGPTGSHLFEVRTWNVNDVVRRQAMATPKAAPYFFARLPASYPPVRRLPAAHRPTQHALQEARP